MASRELYEISRSQHGPRKTRLKLPEGAWELVRDADPKKKELGSVTIGLDDFQRESVLASGHYEVRKAARKPPAPAIPQIRPTEEPPK